VSSLSDFVGEQKGSSSVVELDEEHMTIQIVDFAQDGGLFPEMQTAAVISNWSDESATFLDLFGFHLENPCNGYSLAEHFMCRLHAENYLITADTARTLIRS
jgi:hypothetical protein